jgi:hypothetical protein
MENPPLSMPTSVGERERATLLSLQTTGQRTCSVHLAERICTFYLLNPQSISWRARGQKVTAEGWRMGTRYVVRGHNATQPVLNKEIKRAQGFCPWGPPREGARDQSSSARRGPPSKGEARALHHQPAPALTLITPCRGAHLGPWHLRLVPHVGRRVRACLTRPASCRVQRPPPSLCLL